VLSLLARKALTPHRSLSHLSCRATIHSDVFTRGATVAEIAYIDESYDDNVFAMSALILSSSGWRDCFNIVKDYRSSLKRRHGIFTSKELHATTFIAGRGRIADRVVPRGLRAAIFHEIMDLCANLPGAKVISGAWELNGRPQGDVHALAFGRIQDRLQRRCVAERGEMMRVVDEGRETELRKIARRAAIFNMVGSRYGAWEDGSRAKNIPTERLIEDPIFKSSAQSHFLQLADFIAFALLKSETPITARVQQYGLHLAYDKLAPICASEAARRDHRKLGIIRV
jgi:hypothetical protein